MTWTNLEVKCAWTRLAEIAEEIYTAQEWGAKLTALEEERKHLLQNLGLCSAPASPPSPPSSANKLPTGKCPD